VPPVRLASLRRSSATTHAADAWPDLPGRPESRQDGRQAQACGANHTPTVPANTSKQKPLALLGKAYRDSRSNSHRKREAPKRPTWTEHPTRLTRVPDESYRCLEPHGTGAAPKGRGGMGRPACIRWPLRDSSLGHGRILTATRGYSMEVLS
jgi:hypothetical protein